MTTPNMTLEKTQQLSPVARRLAFFKGLQLATNRIHSSNDADEIILELSAELCALFEAERLTIYTLAEKDGAIVTRVKTGLNTVQSIRLPVSDSSIAGYVAKTGAPVNVRDVYDEAELRAISPTLHFQREVDLNSGFRSRQMLVAPIRDPDGGRIIGVIQLINTVNGEAFSKVAEEGLLGLTQTLGVALARHSRQPARLRSRFDALVADGRITAEELRQAIREARSGDLSTESILVDGLGLTAVELGEAAARYFGVPYQPFRDNHIRPMDLLRNIKRDYVEQSKWLPYEETAEGVVVLCIDPEQVRSAGTVQNVLQKKRLSYRVTSAHEFELTVEKFFDSSLDDASVGDLLFGLGEDEDEGGGLKDDVTAAADNELVKLVNKIIVDAYRQGASDIHIEPRPGREKTLVRFRKDGSLVPYIEVPASYRSPLVTRIKVMCDLDISERRKPQDGKIKFRKFAPLDVELRVATLPTQGGLEDVVMRLLPNNEPLPITELGLLPFNLERLQQAVTKPYGIFFVCGPTGAGKTTTLHSILNYINTPETKIWTVEDPVEITQKGLRQVQVNRKAGIDFATMMRAFLRADPDVIMVGEMRDVETAGMAVEASLTGHLVLSTLHTNSAPETVTRLLDMGMDPFNFADSLLVVLAQRLVRRLCTHCRVAEPATEAYLDELARDYLYAFGKDNTVLSVEAVRADWQQRFAVEGVLNTYHSTGCEHCSQTGYSGRAGIHELMSISRDLRRLIQTGSRAEELQHQAMLEGMRTLRQDGIEKVLSGITSLDEVRATSNV